MSNSTSFSLQIALQFDLENHDRSITRRSRVVSTIKAVETQKQSQLSFDTSSSRKHQRFESVLTGNEDDFDLTNSNWKKAMTLHRMNKHLERAKKKKINRSR